MHIQVCSCVSACEHMRMGVCLYVCCKYSHTHTCTSMGHEPSLRIDVHTNARMHTDTLMHTHTESCHT